MKPVIVIDLIHHIKNWKQMTMRKDRQTEEPVHLVLITQLMQHGKCIFPKTFFFSFRQIPSTTHIQTRTTLFALPFKHLSV